MFIRTQITSIMGGIGAVLIMILVDDAVQFVKKNYRKYIFLDAKTVVELLAIGGIVGTTGTVVLRMILIPS
jgi:hypothetical protein